MSPDTMTPLVALGVATPDELRRILQDSLRAGGPLQGGARPVLLRLDARLLRDAERAGVA